MQNLQQRKIPVICTCIVTVDKEIPGRQCSFWFLIVNFDDEDLMLTVDSRPPEVLSVKGSKFCDTCIRFNGDLFPRMKYMYNKQFVWNASQRLSQMWTPWAIT